MSLPTLQELQALSLETGFLQNPLEKILRIGAILKLISAHPFLKDKFVLKGGSALNLFYFDLPRLSVDIDLNYIGSLERKEMLEDKKRIHSVMNDLFLSDYRIGVGKDEFALTQFEFYYKNLAVTDDKLKVEINYLHRLPLIGQRMGELNRFEEQTTFPVLPLEDILASKVIALLSRYTSRDLFDIYQISKPELNLDLKLSRSLVLYYGLISRTSVFELFEMNLDSITEYDIRNHLHPLMARGVYPKCEVIVKEVERLLVQMLSLADDETEAIEVFYNTGELDFGLIFPQSKICEKIMMSPAFRWKVQNLVKYSKRGKGD
jgi:predicted nucleotidyltransferase component of viral defense system